MVRLSYLIFLRFKLKHLFFILLLTLGVFAYLFAESVIQRLDLLEMFFVFGVRRYIFMVGPITCQGLFAFVLIEVGC